MYKYIYNRRGKSNVFHLEMKSDARTSYDIGEYMHKH